MVQLHTRDVGELISHPEDRAEAARSYIGSVGGKLHGFWYAFGTHDGYNLWEAPDNVSMAHPAPGSIGAIGGCSVFRILGACACAPLSAGSRPRTCRRAPRI
ncbi:GYD domain-containing protein [Streptomyces atroolivaceus]|uniref:GYD domain-containing protein n=1 Tax=Streptomyces atroolivaceus TaxID=66869 RepID=UPI00365898A4